MDPMQTKEIAKAVYFNSITDPRFKTDRISVNLILPLDGERAAKNALVPFLLERSSRAYPDPTALSRALDTLYGATLTGSVRKLGDQQVLSLSISSIDDAYALDGEPMVQRLAEILSGNLFAPAFEQGTFDSKLFAVEKQNLMDLIESEINDKRSFTIQRAERLMYEGEPSGVDKLGGAEAAKRLSEQEVAQAYETLLQSARVEIFFTGCGDPKPAAERFAAAFEAKPRAQIPDTGTKLSPVGSSVRTKTDVYDVVQSKLALGFKLGETPAEDLYAIRLMTSLYGGTPTSKLFVNVREKMSLCYYCAARFDRYKNTMLVDCGVENENVRKAKDAILEQLAQVQSGGFTEQELEFARLALKNNFRTVGDSAEGVEAWYLGQRLSGTAQTPEAEAAALDRVTAADVRRVAERVQLDTVYLLTGEKGCAL